MRSLSSCSPSCCSKASIVCARLVRERICTQWISKLCMNSCACVPPSSPAPLPGLNYEWILMPSARAASELWMSPYAQCICKLRVVGFSSLSSGILSKIFIQVLSFFHSIKWMNLTGSTQSYQTVAVPLCNFLFLNKNLSNVDTWNYLSDFIIVGKFTRRFKKSRSLVLS